MDDDRTAIRRRNFRPPVAEWEAARAVLAEHDWQMNEFLTTCLVAVAATPASMLRSLRPYRTKPRRGRPRKST